MKHFTAITALALAAVAAPFTADFEGGNLNAWTGQSNGAHNGQIVVDPLNGSNNALHFTARNQGGDMFTIGTFTHSAANPLQLSLRYLGVTAGSNNPTDTGGYIGFSEGLPGNHMWRWATGSASGALDVLIDDDTWHSYTFILNAPDGTYHLMIEDFVQSDNLAGNAYFDDLSLVVVPEPATVLVLGGGAALLVARRRRGK